MQAVERGRGLTYRKHAHAPAGTVGKAGWPGKWAALRKPHGLGSTCEARSTQRERLGLQEANRLPQCGVEENHVSILFLHPHYPV